MNSKENILITGATGSGKTTLLKTLLQELNKEEHIISNEDTYEIPKLHDLHTPMLADESKEQKSMVDLCKYTMRMSPKRLVVGEIRSHEVIPLSYP